MVGQLTLESHVDDRLHRKRTHLAGPSRNLRRCSAFIGPGRDGGKQGGIQEIVGDGDLEFRENISTSSAISRQIDSTGDSSLPAGTGGHFEARGFENHGQILESDGSFGDGHRIRESREDPADLIQTDAPLHRNGNTNAPRTMHAEIDGAVSTELEGTGRDQRFATRDGRFQTSHDLQIAGSLGLVSFYHQVGEALFRGVDGGFVREHPGGLQAFEGGLIEERSYASLRLLRQGGEQMVIQRDSG